MSQAIYRKFRPQRFSEIVGQRPIVVTLQNEVEHQRIAHAYLFSGPRGVGKTTMARLLAKTVNCQKQKKNEPCGTCDACKEIAAGRALDLIEIDAASHTGVDNVRENIIENARFTPQRFAYKVFIIDEVHMLSISAFNALLKTLEEPPDHVIFIMATTEIHRVPETIISRCQRFDFKRVSVEDLLTRLRFIAKEEKVDIDEDVLHVVARRAEGSVRDAEVLLGQLLSLGEKHVTMESASLIIPRSNFSLILEFYRALVSRNAAGGLTVINRLVDEGINIMDFTRDTVEFFRKILMYKISRSTVELDNLELGKEILTEVEQLTEQTTVARLVEIIETLLSKSREARYSQIIQLPLELAVVELCTQQPDEPMSPPSAKPPASSHPTVKSETASKPTVSPAPKKGAIKVSLEHVQKAWNDVVNAVRQNNHSAGLSLKTGQPYKVDGDQLVVAFQHRLHAERMKERSIRSIVEDACAGLFGERLTLATVVLPTDEFSKLIPAEPEGEGGSILDQAMQVFGGAIANKE
ncbi:MAG: DNA polymerase III subunit gamma/tau [Patescibacteria group bacterium]